MPFKVCQNTIFRKIIFGDEVPSDPRKLHMLTNNKNELQTFLGIMNYLGKFLPSQLEEYKPLKKGHIIKMHVGYGTAHKPI